MSQVKTVDEWMAEQGITAKDLIEKSGLERRVVEAMIQRRYTPSPKQRELLASALGVSPDQVQWGHQAEVSHIQGHGPQFGRSP